MKRNMWHTSLVGLAFLSGCGKAPEPAVVEVPTNAKVTITEAKEPPTPVEKTKAETPALKPIAEAKPPAKETPKQEAAPAVVGFEFPTDSGGKNLATLLPPKVTTVDIGRTIFVPKPRLLPGYLEPGNIPVPDAGPVTLRTPTRREFVPMALPERVPTDFAPPIDLPARPALDTGTAYTQPTRDPSQPADLPYLSTRPVTDRAPLNDPTLEFTAQSVIAPVLPLRSDMATFMKLIVPEPPEPVNLPTKATPIDDPLRMLPIIPIPKP